MRDREHAVLLDAIASLKKQSDLSYAEVRFVEDETERVAVRNAALEHVESVARKGVAIRVLCDGAWGFAAAPGCEPSRVMAIAKRAVDVARASARAGGEKARLAPIDGPSRGSYASRVERDPFSVSLDEKIELLVRACDGLRANEARVRRAEASMFWTRQSKRLVTTDGTDVTQHLTWGGAGMQCVVASDAGIVQRRSFPTAVDGDVGQGGYERVAAMSLVDESARVREEALALLHADPVPAGRRTIILESSQLALQIHDSCGHATELDRAFGTEISLAGGSFLTPSRLGSFRYGSPIVHLVADATSPGGLGTFGWDDEGTPAMRTDLVREGIFVGYLSSRESAARLGIRSSGAMRADGPSRSPLIRMVNVNLEADPRGPTLEELVADTDDGLLLATNKSWSIDDVRLNFQFGCEAAWEIKNGKRTRLLRDPVYTGITPEFWGSCDVICAPSEWRLWGLMNCGKGEPVQLMGVGHGTAPARFRNVEVGHG
jgi:TldD protein